ncbi:MAG TPA: hypothetical protein VGM93_06060, partial [Acidimicrobiales bacterium]
MPAARRPETFDIALKSGERMADVPEMELVGSWPSTDRREDGGLVYDPDAATMALGGLTVALPPWSGNRGVLEAYVDLVSQRRGARPAGVIEVRETDIEGLSAALDLEAADLVALIESVLHAPHEAAVGILGRLKERRFALAVAGVAVGAMLVGGLAVSAAAQPTQRGSGRVAHHSLFAPRTTSTEAAPAAPVAHTGAYWVRLDEARSIDRPEPAPAPAAVPMTASFTPAPAVPAPQPVVHLAPHPDVPITSAPGGVGLIDPITVDHNGVGLIP